MKPEDQQIAIAEALGFRNMRADNGIWFGTAKESQSEETWPLPDYLNDLNAMYAAEQTLRDQCLYWPDYIDELVTLCTNAYPHLPNEKLEPNWSATVGATAEQRAEAFLRCLGLWKD